MYWPCSRRPAETACGGEAVSARGPEPGGRPRFPLPGGRPGPRLMGAADDPLKAPRIAARARSVASAWISATICEVKSCTRDVISTDMGGNLPEHFPDGEPEFKKSHSKSKCWPDVSAYGAHPFFDCGNAMATS